MKKVVITKKEIDEIADIITKAYLEVYEGRGCRLSDKKEGIFICQINQIKSN